MTEIPCYRERNSAPAVKISSENIHSIKSYDVRGDVRYLKM